MAADPKDKPSYNDEMRRWMAKQSFWHRLKYGRHPGNKNRLLAFLGKVAFIALGLVVIAYFGYRYAVLRRVSSSAFGEYFYPTVEKALDARTVSGSRFSWDGESGSIRNPRIVGGRRNFFTSVEADAAFFHLDMKSVVTGGWAPTKFEISGLNVVLRSGAFPDKEWEKLSQGSDGEETDKDLDKSDWLVPEFSIASTNQILFRDFSFQWGADPWMQGMIRGEKGEAQRTSSGWLITINEGEFQQNWIKNARIDKLQLEVTKAKIQVLDAKFTLESGAKMTLAGAIELGDDPEFGLVATFNQVSMVDLVDEKFSGYLSGKLDGEVRLGGSPNRKSGIITRGRFVSSDPKEVTKVGRSSDAELAVLKAFGTAYGVDAIRYFTSNDTEISFQTSQGNLMVTELRLSDSDVGEMETEFTYDRKAKQIAEGGKLKLSLDQGILDTYRQLRLRGRYLFEVGGDDRLIFETELKGEVPKLTEEAAAKVFERSEEEE